MKAYHMRAFALILVMSAAAMLMPTLHAFAQTVSVPGQTGVFLPNATSGTVTAVAVPYGDTINALLQTVRDSVLTIIVALAAYAGRSLPGVVGDLIKMAIANKWLDRAVDFGFNATEGALAGKTVSVHVGSAVAVNAVSYMMAHAPAWLIDWLGGHENDIRDRIIARIPTEQGATLAATVGGTVASEVAQPPSVSG